MYPEGKQSELWVAHNAILLIRTYFSVKDSEQGHITSVRSFNIRGAWLLRTTSARTLYLQTQLALGNLRMEIFMNDTAISP